MIVTILIQTIVFILSGIFAILPTVSLTEIPVIGEFVASSLTSMVLIWNAFLITFPYAQTTWDIFLFVILPFEGIMLIAKFFLGHRLPTNTN